MNELKPCPFCGGEAAVVWGFDKKAAVYCKKCPATILGFYGRGKKGWHHVNQVNAKDCEELREKLIETWNRRMS